MVGRFHDRGFSHNQRYVQKQHQSSNAINRRRAAEKIARENEQILRRLESTKASVQRPATPAFPRSMKSNVGSGGQPPMRFK